MNDQRMTVEEAIAILDPACSTTDISEGSGVRKRCLRPRKRRAAWLSGSCGNISKRKAVKPREAKESSFLVRKNKDVLSL